jgi:hypothetical protein
MATNIRRRSRMMTTLRRRERVSVIVIGNSSNPDLIYGKNNLTAERAKFAERI